MSNKTKNMDWSALKIKRAIEDAGSSQRKIARRLGKSPTAINRVIWLGMTSDAIRREIAGIIGTDVVVIWPSYYLKDQRRAA